MLLLSPSRYFSCRDKHAKGSTVKRSSSTTSSSPSTASCESLRSASSSSSRTRSETHDKSLYLSFTNRLYSTQQYGESDIDMEVDEGAQWFDYTIDECDWWTQSPSPLVLDLPHSCMCKTRSTCPDFLWKHFIYVQTHEGRRPHAILLTAYLASADAYAQSLDALSRPTAKLERAKAEYDWTLSRQNHRLWSPRLQDQLSTARSKIVQAEEELESLSRQRWEKARCLMNLSRF